MTERRLTDLHRPGQPFTFHDDRIDPDSITDDSPDGTPFGPITVWLQKVSPAEQQVAVTKSRAAKARFVMACRDHNSDEYMAALDGVMDLGGDREPLVSYVIGTRLAERRMSIEAQLQLGDTEWAKDGYLAGLRTAWQDGLNDVWARRDGDDDPEAAEARSVLDEMGRFDAVVQERLDEEHRKIVAEYADTPVDELEGMAVTTILDNAAINRWAFEFDRWTLYHATRKAQKRTEYYFNGRAEVDELQEETLDQLLIAYRILTIGVLEGKDSPPTSTSSQQSVSLDAAATSDSSGPPAATG